MCLVGGNVFGHFAEVDSRGADAFRSVDKGSICGSGVIESKLIAFRTEFDIRGSVGNAAVGKVGIILGRPLTGEIDIPGSGTGYGITLALGYEYFVRRGGKHEHGRYHKQSCEKNCEEFLHG